VTFEHTAPGICLVVGSHGLGHGSWNERNTCWRGGLLDGRAGMIYALQRTYAELLLVLMLDEARSRKVKIAEAATASAEPT
jgi:hypothetical protein